MWSRLNTGAEAAHASDEAPKTAALNLLAKNCSMMLVPDDRAAPFKPMLVTANGRSMLPEDLTVADIDLLADLAPTWQQALLKARVEDLV